MGRALQWNANGYMVPVVASVLAHGLLVVMVAWGWESAETPKQRVTPRYVEATLVTIQPEATKPKAAAPKPKVVDLAARQRQQKAEAERKKRLAMEKAEREKLRKEQEAKRKKAEELQRKKQQQAEKDRRERERLERERQRQLEAERQRKLQEDAFADALAEEQDLLLAEQSSATRQGYVAAIAERIEHNWSRPPSARLGMKCELRIQMVPTGDVVNVTVVKSSGNAAFDRSAEQAVNKVGRFDVLKGMPPDMFEQYFRQFTLVFNPQDLRQ